MYKLIRPLLILLVAVASLTGCKKKETDFNVMPKSQIIFDDQVDKITADYRKTGNLTLKVGVVGAATSVRVTSTYSVGGVARRVDLGTFPVNGGAAQVNVPATAVRAAADGAVVGAGTMPASSRAANTYILEVDAINPDNSTERRFFSAVITQ
ncbi:hypothetical protein GCM10023185_01080 [Hymenobacter saemangeumensis]|uniref:DUF1735 domain-containing protein n=1 Tax=Hymenobacter saemangeumensis TaxID=1084522 RepID=A0ABP8HX88_9BACT